MTRNRDTVWQRPEMAGVSRHGEALADIRTVQIGTGHVATARG